jgi:hypothetical protein
LTAGLILIASALMTLKTIAFAGLVSSTILMAGCVQSLDGRTRPGLPFVKNTIESRYERPPMEIWQAAKDVLRYNGTLYSEDTLKSTLEASVNQRTVWIQVLPIDTKVSQVLIQTLNKAGGTDLELAGEIDKQIAVRLASGNLTPFRPLPKEN